MPTIHRALLQKVRTGREVVSVLNWSQDVLLMILILSQVLRVECLHLVSRFFENYRSWYPLGLSFIIWWTYLAQNIIFFYCMCQYRGNCGLDDKPSHGKHWCNFHWDLSQSLVVPGRSSGHQKSPDLPRHPQRRDGTHWRGIIVFVSKLLLGFLLLLMFLSAKVWHYFFFFFHMGCSLLAA